MSDKMISAAEKILNQSKKVLCSHIHSLIRGFDRFRYVFTDSGDVFTDGVLFSCDAEMICRKYYENKNSVNRLLLHSLLHCMLLHPFNTDFKDKKIWNLACDMAVENTINNWSLSYTNTDMSDSQKKIINKLSDGIKNLTAENIYYYLSSKKTDDVTINELSEIFFNDSHDVWYQNGNYSFGSEDDITELAEIRSIYKRADPTPGESVITKNKTLTETVNSFAEDTEEAWRKIAAHISYDEAKGRGFVSGVDYQLIKSISEKKYDYDTYLKSFLLVNETIEVNDDEFDYIFYTYGLKLYENMPIVEPLEYVENSKIKKLFIAIDTSGSVKGDMVQGFMEKTYSVLKTEDYFSSECEIHIIQCDSSVRDVSVIHTQEELEYYVKNVALKGFGGTDFTPVFDYVSNICDASPNSKINGLIYFTDGDGTYPAQMPSFKTVFAIHDNGFNKSRVPVWATVLYINKNDFIR